MIGQPGRQEEVPAVHPRRWASAGGRTLRSHEPLLDADNLGTLNLITGDSSGVLADIQDIMPVWLTAGQANDWLTAEP